MAAKRLTSVLVDDMTKCCVSKSPYIERHHVFGGANRKKSEQYGFIVPLRYDLHNFGANSVHANPNSGLDLSFKRMAQAYFEEHYGNRKAFIAEFGKSYFGEEEG